MSHTQIMTYAVVGLAVVFTLGMTAVLLVAAWRRHPIREFLGPLLLVVGLPMLGVLAALVAMLVLFAWYVPGPPGG